MPRTTPMVEKNKSKQETYDIINLRKDVDIIDEKILDLINQRLILASQIGNVKGKQGKPVIDKSRENDVIQRLINLNNGPVSPEALRRFFKEIIMLCREIQNSR